MNHRYGDPESIDNNMIISTSSDLLEARLLRRDPSGVDAWTAIANLLI